LQALLAEAPGGLLPALAIGAFAGLRTSEVLRLVWADIDLVRNFIHVAAAKAKSARRRLVPISPNLVQWLAPYAKSVGRLYHGPQQSYHLRSAAAASAAGLARWPKNGLRHSFASYHLALHQNAAETSLHLGHASPAMLFEHYRELVTKEEALRYWSIRPANRPKNVVQLKGEAM
jgi:integrase